MIFKGAAYFYGNKEQAEKSLIFNEGLICKKTACILYTAIDRKMS